MAQPDLVLKRLQELGIEHKTYHHEALFTVDQAAQVASKIVGTQCKNLFLKDDKKRLYLVSAVSDVTHETKINLKNLSKYLQAPGLRFANAEQLQHYLGVQPGSVTPFGLIFDTQHVITMLLDAELFKHELVGFHPLENTATTVIKPDDLEKFIQSCKNSYSIINFNEIEV